MCILLKCKARTVALCSDCILWDLEHLLFIMKHLLQP